ncbi:MAG: M23 family metallopeptidase [Humibacillus sp.]|nr:M23 family metallopeptidase [Humibacillus sp.]MDN5778344.1 M23 family metallopeptidase [Humibacillus sp.]
MPIGESVATALLAAALSIVVAGGSLTAAPLNDAPRQPNPSQGWQWPLAPVPAVERGFDPPDQPWLPGHRGVDLRATSGQPVLAPMSGQVTFSGPLAGRGVLVVTHPNGLRSTFEPVEAGLAVGQGVATGQPVAQVSDEGGHCAPVVCLHWGVLRERTYLDPLSLLGRRPVVLLPLN